MATVRRRRLQLGGEEEAALIEPVQTERGYALPAHDADAHRGLERIEALLTEIRDLLRAGRR